MVREGGSDGQRVTGEGSRGDKDTIGSVQHLEMRIEEEGGRRKEERGTRREEGGRKKEEGGRREGGKEGRDEGRRREEGGREEIRYPQ
jgi:hypothetical protein